MNASPLDRRLLAYSITAGVAVAGGNAAGAIVYHDVDPDLVINVGGMVMIALEGANPDVMMRVHNATTVVTTNTTGSGSSAVRRRRLRKPIGNFTLDPLSTYGTENDLMLHGTARIAYGTNSYMYYRFAGLLGRGRLISADAGFWLGYQTNACRRENATTYAYSHTAGSGWTFKSSVKGQVLYSGPWFGVSDGYLGLRLNVAGQSRHAWMRLSVSAIGNQVTLHDWAYQEESDTPILAGDVGRFVAVGRKTEVAASDAGLPGGFAAKPKVYGQYVDPVKGGQRTVAVKVLDRPDPAAPPPTVACEWKRRVALYDKADFAAAYKAGTRAAEFLLANPQPPLQVDQWLESKELPAPADLPDAFLHPPQIAGVYDVLSDDRIFCARAGAQVVVRGSCFGKKAPKAWLEYLDGTVVKKLKLKVVKPLHYEDIGGAVDRNAMDPASGASWVVYQLPDRLPDGWVHGGGLGGTHDLVLDNGVGIAVADFDTRQ